MACQRLGDLRVDALAREGPRLDLVFWVVAQRVEDGAPSLLAKLVVAKTVSEEGATRASKGIDSKVGGGESAYSSFLRVVLVAMASATCFAPSGWSALSERLCKKDTARCQRVLTARLGA